MRLRFPFLVVDASLKSDNYLRTSVQYPIFAALARQRTHQLMR